MKRFLIDFIFDCPIYIFVGKFECCCSNNPFTTIYIQLYMCLMGEVFDITSLEMAINIFRYGTYYSAKNFEHVIKTALPDVFDKTLRDLHVVQRAHAQVFVVASVSNGQTTTTTYTSTMSRTYLSKKSSITELDNRNVTLLEAIRCTMAAVPFISAAVINDSTYFDGGYSLLAIRCAGFFNRSHYYICRIFE